MLLPSAVCYTLYYFFTGFLFLQKRQFFFFACRSSTTSLAVVHVVCFGGLVIRGAAGIGFWKGIAQNIDDRYVIPRYRFLKHVPKLATQKIAQKIHEIRNTWHHPSAQHCCAKKRRCASFYVTSTLKKVLSCCLSVFTPVKVKRSFSENRYSCNQSR